MTRQKIQIKKIDNTAARQVTFSKRRKGIFKKAQELSTLCDAEIALIVFSATGKVFEYSSSSMKELIERRNMRSENLHKLNAPSLELQVESSTSAVLKKEIEERNNELKHMRGKDLQGLSIEELKQLEKQLQGGLSRVLQIKGEKMLNEIDALKWKERKLLEENKRMQQLLSGAIGLRTMLEPVQTGQSSGSNTTICISEDPPQDSDSSDTSLRLGLPYPK